MRRRLADFLFPIQSDQWLTVLRVGLAIQIAIYCLSLRTDWNYLFAGTSRGLISRDMSEVIASSESAFIPRLGWLVDIGRGVGLSEEETLAVAWFCLLGAACFLFLGLFSRTMAIAAWFLHLSAVKSGGFLSYGMDNFATIGLFYLMISPLPDALSLDFQFRKLQLKDRQLLGFCRRILQLHLCLIYFFGGLTKVIGPGWWNGTSIWRALTDPPFNMISPDLLVRGKYLLPATGIAVCVIEAGYPLFIWLRRTRLVWLVATIGMHVAIAMTMGMYLFSLVLIILNLAAFGPGHAFAEWPVRFPLLSARARE
jgi:hypothetical protein